MEAQLITQQSSIKEYPIRYIGVVFGNPRSPECAGYGICKMEDEGTERPQKKAIMQIGCPRYIAAIERVEKEGKIYLFFNFLKSALSAEIIKKYFSETHFRIGSDLLLPISMTKAFNLPPLVLRIGLFAITKHKVYFQIRIVLGKLSDLQNTINIKNI